MRRMFRLTTLLFLSLAVVTAACGSDNDDLDALDRELDLAMAEDSLAELDDAPIEGEGADAPAEVASETEPPTDAPRESPPPRRETPPT